MDDKKSHIKPWKVISSAEALDEKWFPVRKDTVQLPSGKIVADYFVWESPDIATAVPVTKEGKFVLVRQYRHGTGKVMLQFPAGGINKNEEPIEAAKREMLEETGYTSDRISPLSVVSVYPTKLTGLSYLFFAQNAHYIGGELNNENEATEVVLVTLDELEKMVTNNQLQVADTLVACLLAIKAYKITKKL